MEERGKRKPGAGPLPCYCALFIPRTRPRPHPVQGAIGQLVFQPVTWAPPSGERPAGVRIIGAHGGAARSATVRARFAMQARTAMRIP